jgi:hypothetical protein
MASFSDIGATSVSTAVRGKETRRGKGVMF